MLWHRCFENTGTVASGKGLSASYCEAQLVLDSGGLANN
jgi:hypothetical protein